MTAMNHREISIIAAELSELEGCALSKVHQPDRTTLVFDFHCAGDNRLLLLCVGDDHSRLHLVERKPRNPAKPFAFVMLLRNRLSAARLGRIEAQDGERVLSLHFDALDADGEEKRYILLAELTGRHANAFFLDERSTILASLRTNRSKKRELRQGEHYRPMDPPQPSEMPLRFIPFEGEFGANRAAEAHFGGQQREFLRRKRQTRLRRELKRLSARLKRGRKKLEADLREADESEHFRFCGDLLRSHFPKLSRGMAKITLENILDGSMKPQTIALDPAKSPDENIASYYRKAKKGARGKPLLQKRLLDVDDQLDRLLRLRELVDSEEPGSLQLAEKKLGLKPPGEGGEKAGKTGSQSMPYREFVSESGQRIRVGRSAKDNDTLTFRYSKGQDFWFHASSHAGSHTVVSLAKNEDLDPRSLIDAATLAAHYSKAKGVDVEVVYCRQRNLRKPRKAAAGQVLLSGQKHIKVDVDRNRLQRLFATLKH